MCDGADDCGDRSDEQAHLCCETHFVYCNVVCEKCFVCICPCLIGVILCSWNDILILTCRTNELHFRIEKEIFRLPSNYIVFSIISALWGCSDFRLSFVWTVNITCEMPSRFRCANGYCIYSGLLCNQMDDCGDNSDENEELCMTQTPQSLYFTRPILYELLLFPRGWADTSFIIIQYDIDSSDSHRIFSNIARSAAIQFKFNSIQCRGLEPISDDIMYPINTVTFQPMKMSFLLLKCFRRLSSNLLMNVKMFHRAKYSQKYLSLRSILLLSASPWHCL